MPEISLSANAVIVTDEGKTETLLQRLRRERLLLDGKQPVWNVDHWETDDEPLSGNISISFPAQVSATHVNAEQQREFEERERSRRQAERDDSFDIWISNVDRSLAQRLELEQRLRRLAGIPLQPKTAPAPTPAPAPVEEKVEIPFGVSVRRIVKN